MKQLLLKNITVIKKTDIFTSVCVKVAIPSVMLFFSTFVGVFTPLKGQDKLGFGIIEQGHLYVNECSVEQKRYCFLDISVDGDSIKKTCEDFYFNALIDFRGYGWDIKDGVPLSVIIEYLTRLPSNACLEFIQNETTTVSVRIPPVGYWVRLEELDRKYKKGMYWPAALDITIANDTLWLLHRRDRAIDIWFAGPVQKDRSDYFWEHSYTYLSDSAEITKQFSYSTNTLLPINDHFSSASIPDSYIRSAKLKLIRQGEHFFIINLSHGEIYHLGEKIEQVGYFEKGDKPWIRNYGERALLVENRDKGVLITAQPIRQLSIGKPFPNFEPMKE